MKKVLYIRTFSAFYGLLSVASASGEEGLGENGGWLVVRYAWYFAVVAAGLLLLALVRRREKRNLTPDAVKQRCTVLKKKLEEALASEEKTGRGMLAQARAVKLRSAAEEAMWSALRLVDERKDLVFEGIAGELDGVANLFSDISEDSFGESGAIESAFREALEHVNGVLGQIDEIIATRKGI